MPTKKYAQVVRKKADAVKKVATKRESIFPRATESSEVSALKDLFGQPNGALWKTALSLEDSASKFVGLLARRDARDEIKGVANPRIGSHPVFDDLEREEALKSGNVFDLRRLLADAHERLNERLNERDTAGEELQRELTETADLLEGVEEDLETLKAMCKEKDVEIERLAKYSDELEKESDQKDKLYSQSESLRFSLLEERAKLVDEEERLKTTSPAIADAKTFAKQVKKKDAEIAALVEDRDMYAKACSAANEKGAKAGDAYDDACKRLAEMSNRAVAAEEAWRAAEALLLETEAKLAASKVNFDEAKTFSSNGIGEIPTDSELQKLVEEQRARIGALAGEAATHLERANELAEVEPLALAFGILAQADAIDKVVAMNLEDEDFAVVKKAMNLLGLE